ncbi:hypothetical protein KCU65_g1433, partial [Aureobasidium melanogenum]
MEDYIPADDQASRSLLWSSFANAASSKARSVTSTTEGKAWVGPVNDDDGTYEDTEDMVMQQGGRTLPQRRSEYDDFNTLLGNQDLNDFASETQPDDDTRHAIVLISLPVDHTWTDDDLSDEHHLRIGLLLLFNLIQGPKTRRLRSMSEDLKVDALRRALTFSQCIFECPHDSFS